MSTENEIRSNIAKAVNAALELPRPSVRKEILTDSLHYIASLLEYEIHLPTE